jgi:hypothetical protein
VLSEVPGVLKRHTQSPSNRRSHIQHRIVVLYVLLVASSA